MISKNEGRLQEYFSKVVHSLSFTQPLHPYCLDALLQIEQIFYPLVLCLNQEMTVPVRVVSMLSKQTKIGEMLDQAILADAGLNEYDAEYDDEVHPEHEYYDDHPFGYDEWDRMEINEVKARKKEKE